VLAILVRILDRIVDPQLRPVTGDHRMFADLALDSFDLIELALGIEDQLGVAISLADVADWVRGEVDDREFVDGEGRLTASGWTQVRRVMPQVPADFPAELSYPLNLIGHFSIRNLAELVASRLA